jgi:hypothetical protein
MADHPPERGVISGVLPTNEDERCGSVRSSIYLDGLTKASKARGKKMALAFSPTGATIQTTRTANAAVPFVTRG